jgi:hypothetical protein
MSAQLTLSIAPPPRPPRKLMHMIDAGCNPSGPGDIAQFACKRCGHRSEWIEATVTEIRRGIPCPTCNPAKSP